MLFHSKDQVISDFLGIQTMNVKYKNIMFYI